MIEANTAHITFMTNVGTQLKLLQTKLLESDNKILANGREILELQSMAQVRIVFDRLFG